MNALAEFFTHDAGQRRRAWLDAQSARAANALNYYLGPAAQPVNALASALEFTDAGDVTAAADASRNLWNNPSLSSAIDYTTAGVALALPLYSQRLGAGIMDVADDLVRGYDPNRLNAITAYHGSPHDFDRFSMDKIGTGEGAQAYGHGLYFAENEGVARGYRDSVTSGQQGMGWKAQAKALLDEWGDAEIAAEVAEGYAMRADANSRVPKEVWEDVAAKLRSGVDRRALDGRMYEVNINANPDDFLDWDAPLRDQPKIAERLRVDPYWRLKRANEIIENLKADMAAGGRTEMDAIDRRNYELAEQLQSEFSLESASVYAPRSDEMARELREKGIPGVKYRDYGSRGADGAESGTRNFVVFDENLIEIVRKYGIAGAALALGVSAGDVQAAMDREQ